MSVPKWLQKDIDAVDTHSDLLSSDDAPEIEQFEPLDLDSIREQFDEDYT